VSYAVIGDIKSRLPNRLISASSKPTQAEIEAWIAEAQAMLDGTLASCLGASVPYTDANAILQLKAWICEYAEGHTRMAHASTSGSGANDDGKDLVEHFYGRLSDIQKNPSVYGARLASGSAPANACRVRRTASTVDPIFEMDTEM
jgi:hypothetical protein